MPALSDPDDFLPPRPPTVPARNFIVGGLFIITSSAIVVAYDEVAFAVGFPNRSDPLLWLNWMLIALQTVLGMLLAGTLTTMAFMEFSDYRMRLWLKRHSRSAWERLEQYRRGRFSRWHYFGYASLAICGAAMLWPVARFLFWMA
jgi:hypothetical protein